MPGQTAKAGPTAPTLEAMRARLAEIGQDHVLRFYDSLSPAEAAGLLAQIAQIDLATIPSLVRDFVLGKPATADHSHIEPAPFFPADPLKPHGGTSRTWDAGACRKSGEALLRAGKVACFTVAGGQGSRLGYEGPKGCYPAGAVTNKPLFQMFAEQILAASKRYGHAIPWYIMTSPLNHEATVSFFSERDYFSLPRADVRFFPQGVMPSFDMATGKMLLASPGELATNPDGHGGAVKALQVSGSLADMQRRGIEHLSYFQVDNPLVRCVDPAFLGLHVGAGGSDSSKEVSSKMIPKAYPEEKLGVFCSVHGRVEVIEYSDLPERLLSERTEQGELRFLAGSIAVHLFSVSFLQRLAADAGLRLPYHRAEKKIPHVDLSTGKVVKPSHNNGVKLERFIFDALPMCRRSIVLETDRIEEFAPIKNATGVDSVESCRRIQTQRNARWLAAAGAAIPRTATGEPDCTIEISPLTALEPADVRPPAHAIGPGTSLAL
ncbi:MAG: UDPGP type 1 family protein [Phycisphaeraceae bacterium]|nr:UDPGP type 1 family protein [Phycisphaeraceae bacterium]